MRDSRFFIKNLDVILVVIIFDEDVCLNLFCIWNFMKIFFEVFFFLYIIRDNISKLEKG